MSATQEWRYATMLIINILCSDNN